MTRVEILTQLIAHELSQKVKAVGPHPDKRRRVLTMEEVYEPSCYLLTEEGCRCYIGALLTTEELEEVRAKMGHLSVSIGQMWDRNLVPSFFNRVGVKTCMEVGEDELDWGDGMSFLTHVQGIHDTLPLHNDRLRELRNQLERAREQERHGLA